MTDHGEKKKPLKVAVIGHNSARSLGLAAALMLSSGAAISRGKDLSKDPRFTQPDDHYDKLIRAQDKDFPISVPRKGGLKKHIQATRPRWRQPR